MQEERKVVDCGGQRNAGDRALHKPDRDKT